MTTTFRNLLQLDKKKGIVGLILGAAAFVLFLLAYGSAKYGIVFAVLFGITGFLRLNVCSRTWNRVLHLVWAVPFFPLVFFTSFHEIFILVPLSQYPTEVLSGITALEAALNLAVIAILMGVFFLITGNFRFSVIAGSFVTIFLAVANGFIYQFRGNEIIFADIMSLGTALNVAGQYDIRLHYRTTVLLMLWAVLAFSGFCLPRLPKGSPIRGRLMSLAVTAALTCTLIFGASGMEIHMWRNEGTWFNGYYLNFYLSIRGYFVEKPEGYSDRQIRLLEQQYPDAAPADTDDKPHILVIMNESFADLRLLNPQLNTSQPVTPFLDSLTDNVIKGYALASVFGGSTANSEYEFLTGSTMAFMPSGSIPYQQYLKQETASLGWLLQSLGYESMATHPFYEDGWSRPTAYPFLGFPRRTFIDDYPCERMIREYVSDEEMYAYILDTLKAQEDAPLFLFGITMQNHGGYTYSGENFEKTISLEGYTREYPQAEQYLSLIRQSDAALEGFLAELSEFEEDTVVLFFGDHLPNLENAFYEEIHGGAYRTLPEQMLQYTVPFVLWANYDIPEKTVECTSLNYLGTHLLEAAGLALPPYYQFLKDMEKAVPAVSAMGYYSPARGTYLTLDEAEGEEAAWLEKYALLQYNSIFDKSGRSEHFFGQYLP